MIFFKDKGLAPVRMIRRFFASPAMYVATIVYAGTRSPTLNKRTGDVFCGLQQLFARRAVVSLN
jgi:hypothetical protein